MSALRGLGQFFREWVMGRVIRTLAGLLGITQVVIGHWFVVVLGGREGPGLGAGLALAAGVVAANLALVPVLRRARVRSGWAWVARSYLTVGVATILLGGGVLLAWAGALPVGALLALLGVSGETAFQAFRVASGGVVLAVASLLVWGFTLGHSRLDHTRVRLTVRGLPEALRGLRIAQLSDLHVGNRMDERRLGALVDRTLALGADMVVLTGDLFDGDPRWVEGGARVLGRLRAPLGVYAVLGNHDVYTGAERIASALERHAPDLTLLRKDLVRVPHPTPFYVAGVDDPAHLWTARALELAELDELARHLPEDGPTLLLVHRPELFPQAARLGFPLVLAGHTHGGQLAVPGLAGRLNLARLVSRYDRGLFEERGSVLYVNRGAGVAGPAMRIGANRELATLELA